MEDRRKFLRRMVALGLLNSDNAPTEDVKSALPDDLHCPEKAIVDKTVVLFHDESTFQANEDQATFWCPKGTVMIKPKNKGSGIMALNFINEKMATYV